MIDPRKLSVVSAVRLVSC